MTRDEAIEKAGELGMNYRIVDTLEAFGLLKLDAPKTVDDLIRDALPDDGYVWTNSVPALLAAGGLKIVRA